MERIDEFELSIRGRPIDEIPEIDYTDQFLSERLERLQKIITWECHARQNLLFYLLRFFVPLGSQRFRSNISKLHSRTRRKQRLTRLQRRRKRQKKLPRFRGRK